jgi:hypothetical protein
VIRRYRVNIFVLYHYAEYEIQTYGFSMRKAHDEVVHIRLEILEDSGLVCRRDVWLKVSVSERMVVSASEW